MDTQAQPRIQINCSVRTNAKNEVIERSTLLNIRADDVIESVRLFNQLRLKINGTSPVLLPVSGLKAFPDTEEDGEEAPKCTKCGAMLIERQGKNGSFYGCSAYPECNFTKSIE